MSTEILKRVRAGVKQTVFSPAAKRVLSKALSVEIKAKSLRVIAKDPRWGWLMDGRRKEPMKWLMKARAPIPIVKESGEVIFRSATPKSFANGKWVHPGRQPLNVVSEAVKQSRAVIKKRLAREVAAQIRRKLG